MDELRKFYPVWRWSFLGWVIPGLIMLALAIAVAYFKDVNDAVGVVIAFVAILAIFAMCFIGLFIQISSRVYMIRKVVVFKNYGSEAVPRPIAYRVDAGKESVTKVAGAEVFLRRLDKIYAGNIARAIESALRANEAPVHETAWLPITFVTFKPKGTVFWQARGLRRRCRGIQKGHECEIEWEDNPERALSLLHHELAHVVLSDTYPAWTPDEQHRAMKKAQVI
jgi:hypothetical protein